MGSSSLTASLLLLSLVFMQFVAAADQNNVTIKAEPGDNVILTCKDPEQGKIKNAEWNRTDLGSLENVLLYKDEKINPGAQHPSFRDRADLLINQLRKGDVSLILKNTTTDDSGTYECRIYTEKLEEKLISTVSLVVAPDPFPVWAKVLLVLLVPLVLALAAAAGVFYLFQRWKPDQQVSEESGVESVLLPLKVPRFLWFCIFRLRQVDKVEWRDGGKRTVHVNQNGSDQPEEQDQDYRTRTRMDKNLLKTGDLSLTLRWPTDEDEKLYICSVYNRKGDVLMEKHVWLKVKAHLEEVEVGEGVKSVLLPCRTTEDLDGDVRVEWMDRRDIKVHVYQNGSDQPGEQHQFYRTRTKMDGNLLENKDLSLTLSCPTDGDSNIYTCKVYNRKGYVLMVKQVQLEVKAHMEKLNVDRGVESVLLPCRTTEDLDGDVRVEWRDRDNRKVHVYQNGSDQPGLQDQFYRTRTKMDENLLKNKDLSLTLMNPTHSNIFTCRVSSRDGVVLMQKRVQLEVKVQQVELKVESGVESVKLPCRTTEDLDGDVRVEWMDRRDRMVHVYQNGSDQPVEQEQDHHYRTRTKMDENLKENKDFSLTLKWPTFEDMNFYTCRVSNRDRDVLMEKQVYLQVEVKEQVEVEPGVESVLLPCRTTEDLDGDVRVEWMDGWNRKVHVYQNGSDQPGDQDQRYRTRTKMEENLLENKDLSLTLRRPTDGDTNIYTCRVYRDGDVLMKKDIWLRVKAHLEEVEVAPGVESVLLPCRTTEDLDGDVRVVWMDRDNRKVHVYQNGSDQPGDQDQFYRTRTKMDKNLLKNKDLSLTLRRPRETDSNIYTCRVYRDGDVLMEKRVQLWVKAGTVQVQPEDIMEPLLADQSV